MGGIFDLRPLPAGISVLMIVSHSAAMNGRRRKNASLADDQRMRRVLEALFRPPSGINGICLVFAEICPTLPRKGK